MKSMTGFGRASFSGEDFDLIVEVSSVNRKGLEITLAFPRELSVLEVFAAGIVKEFYTRAKVGVSVKISSNEDLANPLHLDAERLRAALESLRNTARELDVAFAPDASFLVQLNDIISTKSSQDKSEKDILLYKPVLEKVLRSALEASDKMRISEAENIKKDFRERLNFMEQCVAKIESLSSGNTARYKEILLQRLASLGLQLDLSDERLLKELSIFADKADISEEYTRLKSHISQFGAALDESAPCGRTLDFICQEMGREVNTIASKANNLDITKTAIAMKNELERLREQSQNIE